MIGNEPLLLQSIILMFFPVVPASVPIEIGSENVASDVYIRNDHILKK